MLIWHLFFFITPLIFFSGLACILLCRFVVVWHTFFSMSSVSLVVWNNWFCGHFWIQVLEIIGFLFRKIISPWLFSPVGPSLVKKNMYLFWACWSLDSLELFGEYGSHWVSSKTVILQWDYPLSQRLNEFLFKAKHTNPFIFCCKSIQNFVIHKNSSKSNWNIFFYSLCPS